MQDSVISVPLEFSKQNMYFPFQILILSRLFLVNLNYYQNWLSLAERYQTLKEICYSLLNTIQHNTLPSENFDSSCIFFIKFTTPRLALKDQIHTYLPKQTLPPLNFLLSYKINATQFR